MIRYRLRCGDGHRFDGWFRSSDDFDRRRGTEALACPACGSLAVDRALMAPAVARGRPGDAPAAPSASPAGAEEGGPAAEAGSGAAPEDRAVAGAESREAAMRREIHAALRTMARRVRREAENVGAAFPDEARAIHAGEAERREIYGKASLEETRALLEEGVPVLPLPDLPEDHH